MDRASEWFLKVVLPMLRRKYPACVDWAVALISGSFSFGKADEYSDFDGRLYLPDELCRRFRTALSQDMEACARPGQEWSYAVLSLDEPTPLCRLWRNPSDREAWLEIDEGQLYYVSHWIVVHDPQGSARSFQRAARYYPDEVYPLCVRNVQHCLSRWEDVLHRALSGSDSVTAHIAMGAFLEAAMRLGFLSKRRYGPWPKWMYEAFVELPELGTQLAPAISAAAEAPGLEELPRMAKAISDHYRQRGPGLPNAVDEGAQWSIASEPARTGDRQEQLAFLWYVLWEWAECNLNKAVARSQAVASYLYFTSSLLKALYFGFYVLGREWPDLPNLYGSFRGLPAPVRHVVPVMDEMIGAASWEQRQALMARVLSIYREHMRGEFLLPEQCVERPVWVSSWLEQRRLGG